MPYTWMDDERIERLKRTPVDAEVRQALDFANSVRPVWFVDVKRASRRRLFRSPVVTETYMLYEDLGQGEVGVVWLDHSGIGLGGTRDDVINFLHGYHEGWRDARSGSERAHTPSST